MFGESDFYSRMKMPIWLIRPPQAAVTPGQQTSASSCAEEQWRTQFRKFEHKFHLLAEKTMNVQRKLRFDFIPRLLIGWELNFFCSTSKKWWKMNFFVVAILSIEKLEVIAPIPAFNTPDFFNNLQN